MWRKDVWHHHLVAAVDTGLTAALMRRWIRVILPPCPSTSPLASHDPPITTKMRTRPDSRPPGYSGRGAQGARRDKRECPSAQPENWGTGKFSDGLPKESRRKFFWPPDPT